MRLTAAGLVVLMPLAVQVRVVVVLVVLRLLAAKSTSAASLPHRGHLQLDLSSMTYMRQRVHAPITSAAPLIAAAAVC